MSAACPMTDQSASDSYALAEPADRSELLELVGNLLLVQHVDITRGCLVSTTAYDASRMYYSCPCETGLKCVGRGLYEVPLGEVGICS
nr:hypothetical protein BaRGS_022898 [Batillaria attramentaria]